jgi:hypothetical protein
MLSVPVRVLSPCEAPLAVFCNSGELPYSTPAPLGWTTHAQLSSAHHQQARHIFSSSLLLTLTRSVAHTQSSSAAVSHAMPSATTGDLQRPLSVCFHSALDFHRLVSDSRLVYSSDPAPAPPSPVLPRRPTDHYSPSSRIFRPFVFPQEGNYITLSIIGIN